MGNVRQVRVQYLQVEWGVLVRRWRDILLVFQHVSYVKEKIAPSAMISGFALGVRLCLPFALSYVRQG